MAATTTDAQRRWHTVIHSSAKLELADVPDGTAEALKRIATEASHLRKPSDHAKIKLLRGQSGMMRLRAGDYRAIADRVPPKFRLLLVDRRRDVYDRIGEAKRRAEE